MPYPLGESPMLVVVKQGPGTGTGSKKLTTMFCSGGSCVANSPALHADGKTRMAQVEGLEPPRAVLETAMLPITSNLCMEPMAGIEPAPDASSDKGDYSLSGLSPGSSM